MAKALACCRQGLILAGYAWQRVPNGTERFIVRYCEGCRGSHTGPLFHIRPDLTFCLACLSQEVRTYPDGMVTHMECAHCGQATAVELDEPESPYDDLDDQEFGI